MNNSIALAQKLFAALAVVRILWILTRWATSSQPLEEVVAEGYMTLVRVGLLYTLIGCTFTMPGGGPGWFPLIVGGIIGMAQQASGVEVIKQYNITSVTNITNGFSCGSVFTFFWNISIFVLKASFSGQSVANILTGMFTGATAIWIVSALLGSVSALGVLWLGCRITFRYFLTLFEAYLIASQAFLMGFLGGGSMFEGIGMGVFNAAMNIGIETAALVVVIGVFKGFLTLVMTQLNLAFVIGNSSIPSDFSFMITGASVTSYTSAGIKLVAILLLDAFVILFSYAVEDVPGKAARALSGRLDVRPGEFIQYAKNNSAAIKTAEGVAALAAGGVAAGMLAKGALSGGATMVDRARSAAGGALQGFAIGGVSGAVRGAVVGALTAQDGGGQQKKSRGGGGTQAERESNETKPFSNAEFAPKGGVNSGKRGKATTIVDDTDGERGGRGSEAGARDDAGASGGGSGASREVRVGATTTRVPGEGSLIGAGVGDAKDDAGAFGGGFGASREVRVGATTTRVSSDGSRVEEGAQGASQDVGSRITDATESRNAGAGDAATGGAGGQTTQETSVGGGTKKGTGSNGAQVAQGAGTAGNTVDSMQDLTSAMRDLTASLEQHRFGGSSGAAASGGSGAGGGVLSSGGGIFGGNMGAQSVPQMMLYQALLSGGRSAPAPQIQTEHPSAHVSVGSFL
jgi:hypothetical protein